MIATVTNLQAVPLELGYPFNLTLTESGGALDSVALGVSERDLQQGEDQGDPAWKRLNLLKQEGKITLVIAADANTTDVQDEANEI